MPVSTFHYPLFFSICWGRLFHILGVVVNTGAISIVEKDGYWHAQFYYHDAISSKLQKYSENTQYQANPVFKHKSRRIGKKIYERVLKSQKELQIAIGNTTEDEIHSATVDCPDVINDKGKPMNLLKEHNGFWYTNFSYTKSKGKYARCRKSTKLKATRTNKPEVLRIALAMHSALLQSKSEILEQQNQSVQGEVVDEASSESKSPKPVEFFSKVATDYLKTLEAKGLKKSTLKAYRSILRIHLLPQFGKTPISAITTRSVDKWFSSLKGHNNKPLSGKTRNNIINFLAEIMSKAVAWEYCKENPVKHISRSKLKDQEMLFWSKEERDLFLSTASRHSPTFFPMFATFLFTGMRVGEIIALKWEHIDLANSTIHVQENYVENELTVPKSGKSRFIQICPFLCDVLQKHQDKTGKQKGIVFPTPKGAYSSNDRFRRPFERLVKKANIKKIRMHDMRHTFASLALMSGVDVPTVQKWLGHTDIQTTMRYIKVLPQHMQEQAKKLTPNLEVDSLF